MEMKVEGRPELVKTADGVVKNVDQEAFLRFLAQRDAAQRREQEVTELRSEVAELKALVNAMLQGGNK